YSAVIYRLQEFGRTPDAKNILTNAFTNGVVFEEGREPVSIDFRDIYPDRLGEVRIMPGDSILIPVKTGVVAVYGLVKRPGLINYDGPAGAAKYIGLAGGYASGADKQSIKIIRKTSGMQIAGGPGIDIYDGDTIIIPENRGKKSMWEKIKDGALILGGLGILYLAVDNATD
ncbi:MAG: SLBB domain-containing protein, partial [Candidatus Zixiibacteriota bacterium]